MMRLFFQGSPILKRDFRSCFLTKTALCKLVSHVEMDQGMDSFFDGIVDGGRLDVFVINQVQLAKETKDNYNKAVDEIVSFLNSRPDYGSGKPRDFPWKFKRVFKSGSLQKGTAVRGHADVDLVCFIEKGKTLQEPEEFLLPLVVPRFFVRRSRRCRKLVNSSAMVGTRSCERVWQVYMDW